MGQAPGGFQAASSATARARYGGSILLISNRAPAEWPDLFRDPLLASAGLDRLMHRAEVVIIRGVSFRAQDRQRLEQEALSNQETGG